MSDVVKGLLIGAVVGVAVFGARHILARRAEAVALDERRATIDAQLEARASRRTSRQIASVTTDRIRESPFFVKL